MAANPRRVSRIKPDSVNPNRFYCLNPAWSDQNTWDTGLWRCDGTNWTKLSMEGSGPVYHRRDVDVDPSDNRRLLLATEEDPFDNNTGGTSRSGAKPLSLFDTPRAPDILVFMRYGWNPLFVLDPGLQEYTR